MFLGCWDKEGGNVTPMGSHQKLWGSALGRTTEDWDEGLGGAELQKGVSSPRLLGGRVSVVTPEVVQTKTEPRSPGTPL